MKLWTMFPKVQYASSSTGISKWPMYLIVRADTEEQARQCASEACFDEYKELAYSKEDAACIELEPEGEAMCLWGMMGIGQEIV